VYPAVRVKIWRSDGTVLFSDEERLIGQHFGSDEVRRAATGQVVSEVEDLSAPENVHERGLKPKLFATYVPLYLQTGAGGQPDAVVELYQDYAGIQAAIDDVLRTIVVSITAALAVIYLLLVPVARLTTRTELARKRAVRENSEKSRFLAFMSHELRTPLNSILGFSQLLEAQHHGRLSERQLRHVNNIKTSGHHLLAIINDILDLSKVEAGAMEMRLEPVDVRAVLDEVVIQLSPLCGTRLDLAWKFGIG
jgi:signal transduction histidine kinase